MRNCTPSSYYNAILLLSIISELINPKLLCNASSTSPLATAFQFPTFQQLTQSITNPSFPSSYGNPQLEDELLTTITNNSNKRLDNSSTIQTLIERLESTPSIPCPSVAPEVMGRWRLLYTTNSDTASPIQRKAVDATKFNIYQDITLREEDTTLIVSQIVRFGPSFRLIVDALASTSLYPLPELSSRTTDGRILGLNVLGVSTIGDDALESQDRPDARINFVFDEGFFEWGDRLRVPYPVPFRSRFFREAVKGWIDVTYLSGRVRVSRGNKGTTFVLVKEEEEQQ